MAQTPVTCSVIIPAHDSSAFIDVALNSARRQTLQDIEIVVVDDASRDRTAEVVESAARDDPRVRLIRHPSKKGPGGARNTAFAHATGEWLAVLDSDDEMAPDRLASLVDMGSRRRLDMLADQMEVIDFNGGRSVGPAFPSTWMDEDRLVSLQDLVERDWPGGRARWGLGTAKPIIRRDFITRRGIRYNEGLSIHEDFLLYAEILLAGARFGMSKRPSYRYSIRQGAISCAPPPTRDFIMVNDFIRERVLSLDLDRSISSLLQERGRALRFQYLVWSVRFGRFSQALEVAREMDKTYIARAAGLRALSKVGLRPRQPYGAPAHARE